MEKVEKFRIYKDSRRWVITGVSFFTFGTYFLGVNSNAHADNITISKDRSENSIVTSGKMSSEVPSSTESKSEVASSAVPTSAESKSEVANSAVPTSAESKSEVASSVASNTDVTSKQTIDSKDLVATNASNSQDVTVGNDMSGSFTSNGAAIIDGDTVTLTPDKQNQVGNIVLNNKIDMSQSFTLTGKVNLGDKSQLNNGADGVSFVFQPGDTNVIGKSGDAIGIGGVPGAFGFKLDTFYNEKAGEAYGESATPDPLQPGATQGRGHAFGAFVDGTTGIANTLADTAQQIAEPNNNEFKDIEVYYDGQSKIMKVLYDSQTWSMDISSLLGNYQSMSFAVEASTGSSYNLQQFQLDSFVYSVAVGNINQLYVDTNGNVIAGLPTLSSYTGAVSNASTGQVAETKDFDFSTVPNADQLTADGYVFEKAVVGLSSGGYAGATTSISDTVTFGSNDQTVYWVLVHGTVPVGPTNPENPGSPINPTNPDGPKWPTGTDLSSLTSSGKNTVVYADKRTKTNIGSVTDVVNFGRTAIVDKVTGKILGYDTTGDGEVDTTNANAAWVVDGDSDMYPRRISPDLSEDGYGAPDISVVDAKRAIVGDDIITIVLYDHSVEPVTPVTPVQPLKPIDPNGQITMN